MARTYKHLFGQVVDLANVIDAYRKARRRKRRRDYVIAFDRHREKNLVALRDALAEGAYRPGGWNVVAGPFFSRTGRNGG